MSEFEFLFPLFALLVGLSIAEMLSGLAHALKSKRDVRVGWLTPLLGTLIIANLGMFWNGSWAIRDQVDVTSTTTLLLLIVGGAYFLAASMVFPSPGSEVRNLDDHFMEHRTVPLLAIAACNAIYFVRIAMLAHDRIHMWWWSGNAMFLALLLVAAFASSRRIVLASLGVLIASHVVMLFWG